ncbi:MAG: Dna2/Cas4 domain-containing protein [Anaerovoracaceae bacterium]
MKQQLQLYAHLVEENYDVKVSKMHLYYTSEMNDSPMISFDNEAGEQEKALKHFDSIIESIENKKFGDKAREKRTCNNCDFKYYCKR